MVRHTAWPVLQSVFAKRGLSLLLSSFDYPNTHPRWDRCKPCWLLLVKKSLVMSGWKDSTSKRLLKKQSPYLEGIVVLVPL